MTANHAEFIVTYLKEHRMGDQRQTGQSDLEARVHRLEAALDAILARATMTGQEIGDLHGFVIGLADGMRREGRW